jgi:hypothetical protein
MSHGPDRGEADIERLSCPYCGARMRVLSHIQGTPETWACGCAAMYDQQDPDWESVRTQRFMLADISRKGPAEPSGRDPATGLPWTMGEHFDRHALALLCCREVMIRSLALASSTQDHAL